MDEVNNLIQLLLEGVKDLRQKYVDSGKVISDHFEKLEQEDPTSTKKYLEWMLLQYVNTGTRRLTHLGDLARRFEELSKKNLLLQKDIYKYKTFEDLEKALSEVSTAVSKTQVKKDIKLKDAVKVYENDQVTIINPKTHAAAQLYGKNTQWCITMDDSHYWDDYTRYEGVEFYYIIAKKKFRIQIATGYGTPPLTVKKGDKFAAAIYPDGETCEVYDAEDTQLEIYDVEELSDIFKVPSSIFTGKSAEEVAKARKEQIKDETKHSIFISLKYIHGIGVDYPITSMDDQWIVIDEGEVIPFFLKEPPQEIKDEGLSEIFDWMDQKGFFKQQAGRDRGRGNKSPYNYSHQQLSQAMFALGYASKEPIFRDRIISDHNFEITQESLYNNTLNNIIETCGY